MGAEARVELSEAGRAALPARWRRAFEWAERELGGRVIYEGDFEGLLVDEGSLTARYLRGEAEIKEIET